MPAKLGAQHCDEYLSTNPSQPVNSDLENLFPGKANPWVNIFDFGAWQGQTFDPYCDQSRSRLAGS